MPESGKSGSVGAAGEQSPAATRQPIWVVCGGNVGSRDAAVESTWTYLRRFPEEITRVGGPAIGR